MSQCEHIITFDGETAGAIYSDDLRSLLTDLGPLLQTRRASHVEPCASPGCTDWWVTFEAWVPGPTRQMGPFPTRATALQAEVDYLKEVL